jgi:hypothetical protein
MSQPQPPLDEQGEAREALNSAVTNYGPRILQNPQILGNVVTDLLPDLPREQNLLIAAAEADVATDLSQHVRDQNLEPVTAVQLAAHALAGKKSIDPAASVWVTTEYAKALGYDVPAYVPPPTPSPEAVPVPPPPSHSVPLVQSVPASDAQAVPLVQSVPPPDAQAVPQSDPLAAQSAPPWSVPSWQSAPLAGQQPVPPAGGYGGGAQAGPWSYGPTAPGSPPGPPDNGKKNRGILIAIISAAAVIVIGVAAAGVLVLGRSTPVPPVPSPTNTQRAQPVSQPSSPAPANTGESNQKVADAIANLAVGNGSLGPLTSADGTVTAVQATCDPRTVSNPPDPSTPSTASCDITYSDGTVWQQTVTVHFDSNGDPVSDETNGGIQIG